MSGTATCAHCGLGYAALLLACPGCQQLLHRDALAALVDEAETAEREGDVSRALSAYRRALDLLPPGAAQTRTLTDRLLRLSSVVSEGGAAPAAAATQPASMPKWLAPFGVVGVALFKLKGVLLLLLTKGKVLLFGLAKAKTFFSMMLSFGLYASMWGWPFALGFVLSIYVHEIGHVLALRRYGIAASAPMFIPGFGAFIRAEQYPRTPREDADVGLAGPMAGFAAALVAYLLFRTTEMPIFAAIARSGAAINVFNLIPIWQLDGSRGFSALARPGRLTVAAAALVIAAVAHAPEAALVAVVGAFRAFLGEQPREGDSTVLGRFLFLLAGLGLVVSLSSAHLPPAR